MARLITTGWELGGLGVEGATLAQGTSSVIVSATKRTGTYSLKIPSATNVGESVALTFSPSTANTVFVRIAINVETLPSAGNARHLFMVGGATTQSCICRVNSSGNILLTIWTGSSFSQIAATTGTISTGQWYIIEMKVKMSSTAGFRELKALGETLGGAQNWTTTENTANLTIGSHNVQAGAITAYYDDIAVNDDQGSNQNGYPGDGRAVLLHPASDNSDGSWRLGGGTTGGDLSAPLRTFPPPGVASANETDSTNIESAANSATDNYDANLQSYTDGGIVSGDTINLVQALVRHGEDIATSTKAGALLIVSNPAQSGEDTFNFGNDQGAHGLDDPDNGTGFWVTKLGAIQYAPSVTLGTAPVLRVGKRTATTRVVCVDALGLYVDYTHPEFISASLTATDDADTISAGATLPVAASVTVTDATDTIATAVAVLIVATLTGTDADDSLTADATTLQAINADLLVEDATDTIDAAAVIALVATLTRTDDVDTLDGAVAVAIVATSSNTDSGDALDATALLEKFAALDATDGDDTLGADATLLILATLSATDEDDALSASATLTTAINASLDATDADDSISSSAALVVVASVTVQDDSDTLGASSVLSITATLNVSDEADTPSFAAGIEITASTSVQDAADTLDGIAYLEKFATLDVTDSDDSPSSDADVIIGASLAVTDAGDTLDAAGTVGNIINGDLTVTDADDSLSAGTTIPIVADSVMQDAEDQISSGATSSISAGFGIADDAETLAATSALLIQAALDAADESDTLLAYSSHGPIVADLNVTDESDVLEAQGGKAIAGSGDAYHYPRGSQYDRIMRLYARGKLKTKRGTIVRDPRIAREMARRAALREMEEINVYNQLKG